ncbi:alpha/beta fold hydrolase [Flavobacterium gelatinilyticum]|uniref:alpha/beta fold hydrolase n=1 Tax=Flavobacterium gelatinilyticum TaxID=3003260 RepID=UPI00247FF83A|nr:alpha/beta hydrolase [Flavobacterium gelatinilyticum]
MKNQFRFIAFCLAFSAGVTFTQAQTLDTLTIGKIKQAVSYKGLKDAPLILFLHGGPGSSRMKQAETFSNMLQQHFMVIQWDQRESGKTLALNKTSVPITLDLMVNDTHEVITQLLKKFNKKKLYLVGESWGTVLGFKMAARHPELLYAYLAFSPMINQTKSEQLLLDKLEINAKEKNNVQALKELKTIKIPFGDSQQIYYSRKWMFDYDGHPFSPQDTTALKEYLKSWSDIWLPTWNKAIRQNLITELPQLKCPVYFFLGEKDLQTNFGIAKQYFEVIKAPKKKLFSFKDAGHSVLTEKPAEVQKIIIEEILEK